jgi:hypothetical protein
MQNEFLESYKSCLEKMNLLSVSPFTEHEIQPLYSDIWYNEIILKGIEPKLDNPSILRSMLVMDLLDCPDSVSRQKIFSWYLELLYEQYSDDIFSLRKNLPKKYGVSYYDYTFFPFDCRSFKAKLFKHCYTKFSDIFADNGYEVVGPFYERGYTFVITIFRNLDKHIYKFIEFQKGIVAGEIDMFGHSTFNLNEIALEINDEIIYDIDQLPNLNNNSIENDFERYVDSRLFRLRIYPNGLRDKILKELSSKELQPRIFNIEQIVNLVKI